MHIFLKSTRCAKTVPAISHGLNPRGKSFPPRGITWWNHFRTVEMVFTLGEHTGTNRFQHGMMTNRNNIYYAYALDANKIESCPKRFCPNTLSLGKFDGISSTVCPLCQPIRLKELLLLFNKNEGIILPLSIVTWIVLIVLAKNTLQMTKILTHGFISKCEESRVRIPLSAYYST